LEAAAAVSEQKQQFISITSRPNFGGNYQFGCASSDNNLRHLANPTTNILARPPHRPLAHCDSGTESSDDDEDDEELEMLDSREFRIFFKERGALLNFKNKNYFFKEIITKQI